MLRILHVEDDWMKAKSVRTYVERFGGIGIVDLVHVTCLNDFEEKVSDPNALPDIVITDWCFPLGREKRDNDPEQPLNGGAVVACCAAIGIPCAVYSGYTRPGPDELFGAEWLYSPTDIPEFLQEAT